MIKFEYPHKSKMKFATKETIIKSGRAPSEEQHIVDEKNDLLRENRQKRAKIRELNKQLDSYDYTKERVSMILKSKAMPTADHRYDDLLENIERIPEE